MSEAITLYGSGGNRAARCVWTVDELGIEVTYRHFDGMIGSDELRQVHPQAKVPAARGSRVVGVPRSHCGVCRVSGVAGRLRRGRLV